MATVHIKLPSRATITFICTDKEGNRQLWDVKIQGTEQDDLNLPTTSTNDVPFNLILGTDEISECNGKVGEYIIVEVDYIPKGMSVEWTTDNPKVVTLDPSKLGSQCILWIKAEGTATITATRGDETRTLHLKSENNPNAESFSK